MKDITLKNLKKNSLILKPVASKSEISLKEDLKNYNGYLIDANEKEVRRIIDSLKQKEKSEDNKIKIAVLGRDNISNRRVLETMKIDFLVSPDREISAQKIIRKDTLKQRDSGLNHVLGKIAKENNISIVINFSEMNKIQDKKQKAIRLARIIQNIKICRKSKCKIKIATFASSKEELRDERELKSFGFSLGMSSQQARDACEF